MNAISKTSSLQRFDCDIGLLVKNTANPNKMTAKQFDLLCDNLEKTGMTDAILVRPIGDGKYRIVGGHHRFDAAVYLGFEKVPVCVIDHDDFDADAETFQIVRMNMIKGQMDPQAFFNMWEKVQAKYGDDILQDAFGFSDEAQYRKMVDQAAKSLPTPLMKEKFKEAAKEIRTVDGLSKLLNTIFNKYGDTLPHGFMVFDYASQKQVWLHISHKTYKAIDIIGDMCIEQDRTVDDIIGAVLQQIAQGKTPTMETAVAATEPAALPKKTLIKLKLKPTKNTIADLQKVN
ncbi:ParB-like nuclease protein [Rhizobium phage RHph_Y1_11]|nr:ParB-like nuclease protein [Rhizobium phage RHph_Y1_11]